jgi:hypothetical protein
MNLKMNLPKELKKVMKMVFVNNLIEVVYNSIITTSDFDFLNFLNSLINYLNFNFIKFENYYYWEFNFIKLIVKSL